MKENLGKQVWLVNEVFPDCDCHGEENGPYYISLGYAQQLWEKFIARFSCWQDEVTFVEITPAEYECKTD